MKSFVQKHASSITGVVSGFDRMLFRGTLRRLSYTDGFLLYLSVARILLKDFKNHVLDTTARIKNAALAAAEELGRPVIHIPSSSTSKEQMARQLAREDSVLEGLIAIFTCVEPCTSFQVQRDRHLKRLVLKLRKRQCLHVYAYMMHPVFGFMHARLQTWYPFSIQVCINGREWLARQMDQVGLQYCRSDNCFTWLEDASEAQRLFDQQLRVSWSSLLNMIARNVNPALQDVLGAFNCPYYWTVSQSEWATDVLFQDKEALARVYPAFLRHGITTFGSTDVLRFLGKKAIHGKVPGAFQGELKTNLRKRHEGVRIKHYHTVNSIKLYDKQGSVLRVETTINDPTQFKVFRPTQGAESKEPAWQAMRRGIADLHRRSQVSQKANERYLDALASVDNKTSLSELTEPLTRHARWKGRRVRALNPLSPDDAALLQAVSRGEFTINHACVR